MTVPPRTRYARTADGAHIAYQVVGDGDLDVVLASNIVPIEPAWDEPRYAAALHRLASFSRLILFDRRGSGASDAFADSRPPTAEVSADDILAVMGAVDSHRAAIVKTDGIAPAVMVATGHPHRVSALVIVNGYARLAWAPDYPMGVDQATQDEFFRLLDGWEAELPVTLQIGARAGDDEQLRDWFEGAMRRSAGPAGSAALLRQELTTDVRHLLPLVQVPSLVIHSLEDPYTPVDHGRYIANNVPGARLVELEGDAHALVAMELDKVMDEIAEFLTGVPQQPHIDRILATVLFTDIVNSTALASELGDRRWRALLDEHDALVDRQLVRFNGRLVKTTGDGVLATFDGPARGIACAAAIRDGLRRLRLTTRMGLHTGEVEARGDDVTGVAVHVAARVQAHAQAGEILVSRTVVDLVAGSGITFEDRGEHQLKGIHGQWRLFAVGAT